MTHTEHATLLACAVCQTNSLDTLRAASIQFTQMITFEERGQMIRHLLEVTAPLNPSALWTLLILANTLPRAALHEVNAGLCSLRWLGRDASGCMVMDDFYSWEKQ